MYRRLPGWLGRAYRSLKRVDLFQRFAFAGLLLLAAFMLLPIVFIFNHAFKPQNELFLYPPSFLVKHPTMDNFQNLIFKTKTLAIPFTRYLFNSALTTLLTVLSVILASALAAYVFSKHDFPGRKAFFALTIFALMFAPEAVAIPRYLVIANIGIMNTYLAHILPFIAAPTTVFLMKQFIDQVPREIIEAAKIDGGGEWQLFARIVMPVCVPAISTVGILAFQSSWDQLETSTLYTQTETMKTLPFYVATLTNGVANNVVGQGMAAAAALLMFLPNLFIFLFFQRKVITTMAHSGIK